MNRPSVPRRRLVLASIGAASLVQVPFAAGAESGADFPSKPVRIIVPFGPGGSTDSLARILAEPMSRILRQTVVVENRPGGGGAIGMQTLASSPADGYTIGMGAVGGMTILGPLYGGRIPYDPIKDFAPISLLVTQPSVILINKDVPVRNLSEFVAWVKTRPQETYASGGIGTMSHLTGEVLKKQLDLGWNHVAYKADLPGITDVLGGHVKIMILNISPALPFIKDGRARAIAVTSRDRSPLLPDVESLSEVLGGDSDLVAWQGYYAPAGTPSDVLGKLNAAIVGALADPVAKRRLEESGASPAGNSTGAFKAFIDVETEKWSNLVKLSGVQLEPGS